MVMFVSSHYISVIPKISVNCSNSTTVNQSDNFRCECYGTDGYPLAEVTWYKNNKTIDVTGVENATLVRSNVTKNDSGTYRCEAKSSERAKNETSIELIVNCKYACLQIHSNNVFETHYTF